MQKSIGCHAEYYLLAILLAAWNLEPIPDYFNFERQGTHRAGHESSTGQTQGDERPFKLIFTLMGNLK